MKGYGNLSIESCYKPLTVREKDLGPITTLRQLELRNLEERLGKGHVVYYSTMILMFIAISLSFVMNTDLPTPLPLEIYRFILIGALAIISVQSVFAFKKKQYYLQSSVVNSLKFYISFFILYIILKAIFLPQEDRWLITEQIAELGLILILFWASKGICQELKRREEIILETSFDQFIV